MSKSEGMSSGATIGCGLAMILSYGKWHSILWAILHGLCSWFYVLYFAIKHN